MDSHEQLEVALRSLDDRTRQERAKRSVWLANYDRLPAAIIGRTETLRLLHEVRESFIHGHYAATLLLAIAVIEHSLVEELHARSIITNKAPWFSKVLAKAKEHTVLPSEWFPQIEQLVLRRHSFAHLDSDNDHALSVRMISQETHPKTILEQDAKCAIKLMYQVFHATLHEAT